MNEDVVTTPVVVEDSGFNLYAFMRRAFFILLILVGVLVIFYLLYQNGKSIYDNGI